MTFKIELTQEQLNVIGQALGHAPYRVVAPIITAIDKQVQEQLKPKEASKEAV